MSRAPTSIAFALFIAGCGAKDSAPFPKISVQPGRIDLGDTPIGVSMHFAVSVSNLGTAPLIVSAAAFRSDSLAPHSPNLSATVDGPLPRTLEPGQSMIIDCLHVHRDEAFDSGVLRIESNDARVPNVDIPMVQLAIGTAKLLVVSSLDKADAQADTPAGAMEDVAAVDFGVVASGARATESLFIVNGGYGNFPLRIDGLRLVDVTSAASLSFFARPDPSAGSVLLPLLGAKSKTAGVRSIAVELDYRPTSTGTLAAALEIVSDDGARPKLELPIRGRAVIR